MSEIENEIAAMTDFLTKHVEKFACAFAKETGLDPTKIKMVKQLTDGGLGFKIWFEPFPSDSEIELYRARAETTEADNAKLREMVDKITNAAEPFLTFRKIVTEKPESDWDKELYKHHLDTWNRLIAELNASQNKPEGER